MIRTSGGSDLALPVFLLIAGSWLYLDGWRRLRRRWLIHNLPTSRVRSVAMGLAELTGRARSIGDPLESPVRRLVCIWAHARVVRRTGSGKHQRDTVVFERRMAAPFELDDETGRILVLPNGAEIDGVEVCDQWIVPGIEPPGDLRAFCAANGLAWSGWFAGSLRVTERVLLADTSVFVIGAVDRISDPATSRKRRVTEVLRGWLARPERKAALDLDRSGVIDPEEWAAARAAAQREVLAGEDAPAGPQVAVRKPPSGIFLITAGSQKDALQAQGHPAWRLGLGIALVAAACWGFPYGRYRDYGVDALFAGVIAVMQGYAFWRWHAVRA